MSMDRIKQDLGITRTTLSTEVVDVQLGRPAAGLHLTVTDAAGLTVSGRTDADGRAKVPEGVAAGTARIVFATGPWFGAQDRQTFYPEIEVRFTVAAGEHHHIAVLLGPFSYTTYKGA